MNENRKGRIENNRKMKRRRIIIIPATSSFMTAEERWNAIKFKVSLPSSELSKSRTEKKWKWRVKIEKLRIGTKGKDKKLRKETKRKNQGRSEK